MASGITPPGKHKAKPISEATLINNAEPATNSEPSPKKAFKMPTNIVEKDFAAIFRRVQAYINNAYHTKHSIVGKRFHFTTKPADFNPTKEYINEVKAAIKDPYSHVRRINDVCEDIEKKRQTFFKRSLKNLEAERERLIEIRPIAVGHSGSTEEINRFVAALDFIYESVEAQATGGCDKNIALKQAKTVEAAFFNPIRTAVENRNMQIQRIQLLLSSEKRDQRKANSIQVDCEFANKILRGLNK